MKNWVVLILFLMVTCFSATDPPMLKSEGTLKVLLRAEIGPDSVLHNTGLDVNSKSLTGVVQNGLLMEASIGNAASSANGVMISPKIAAGSGHIPLFNCMTIMPPSPGSGAGYVRGWGLYISDMTGSDSGVGGLYVANRSTFMDTLNANRLLNLGGGVNFHGSILTTSRTLNDTDFYLYFDISGGNLKDTLPLLAKAPGKGLEFVQYSSTAAGKFCLYPHAGEKIETYDSLCMKSNLGRSRMIIIGAGDKWRVLERHEEGIWQASLTGVNPAVTDTGWYSMDNLLDFTVSFKRLVGTSNTTAMGVTGMGAEFTMPSLDTSYTQTAVGEGYDNNVLLSSVTCVYFFNGSDVVCSYTSAVTSPAGFTAALGKGLRFMTTFRFHSPIPAKY